MSFLSDNTPVIFDGAISTELYRRGCPIDRCPELFALTHPAVIEQLHEDYIKAGARVITTATFGANSARLRSSGLTESVRTVNQLLASLAVQVSAGKARVAGSVGPHPEFPTADEGEIGALYGQQIEGLIAGGVDLILIETMTSLAEARLALKAARRITALPVSVSFTFNGNLTTSDEQIIESAVSSAESEGAEMIGVNCMTDSEALVTAVGRVRSATALPILVRPNAGLPKEDKGMLLYPLRKNEFATIGRKAVEAGASAAGGCCGTSPEYIAALRAELKDLIH